MRKWIAGIMGTVIAGLIVWFLTDGIPSDGNEVESPVEDIGPPIEEPSAPPIWGEGVEVLPVNAGDGGQAYDLDGMQFLPIGTSIPAMDVDILVGQAPHGIVIQPGIPTAAGDSFDARFLQVSDTEIGYEACAKAAISPEISGILLLGSNVHVGSHVCMVTTQDRLAEIELLATQLADSPREIELRFTVWAGE